MNNLNTRRIENAAARLNPAQEDVRSFCQGQEYRSPHGEKTREGVCAHIEQVEVPALSREIEQRKETAMDSFKQGTNGQWKKTRVSRHTPTETVAIEALVNGLESFQRTMLSKPYDQAIHLVVALRSAGLRIVKSPRPVWTKLDELVEIHCKAEGPVSVQSIYHYVSVQSARRPMIEDVEAAIDRLVSKGVIELYDADDQMKTYW